MRAYHTVVHFGVNIRMRKKHEEQENRQARQPSPQQTQHAEDIWHLRRARRVGAGSVGDCQNDRLRHCQLLAGLTLHPLQNLRSKP